MSKAQQAKRRQARLAAKEQAKAAKLRSFLGLHCPLFEQLQPLYEALAKLPGEGGKPLRLSPPENLHVTVRFLGSVEVAQLGNIEQLGKQIVGKHTLPTLRCSGVGLFKNSAWVGIEPTPALTALAEELNAAGAVLGIPGDDKGFVPHLTVARFPPALKSQVAAVLEAYANQQWGEFTCQNVNLYRSDTLPDGARYTVIAELPLGSTGGS